MLACFCIVSFLTNKRSWGSGEGMLENWKNIQFFLTEMVGLSTLQVEIWVFINQQTN